MSASSTNFNLWCKVLLDLQPSLFSPQPSILFPEIHIKINIPTKSRFSMTSLSFTFHYHNHMCISVLSHTCHIPYPSHSLILSHEKQVVRSTNHEYCQHVISFSLLLPPPFYNQISSSAPYSQISSVHVPTSI